MSNHSIQRKAIYSVVAVFLLLSLSIGSSFISPAKAGTVAPVQTEPISVETHQPTVEPQRLNVPHEPIPAQVIIQFNPDTSSDERAAYIESVGGTIVKSIDSLDTVVITVSEDIAQVPLTDSTVIAETEPDYYVSALDDVIPSDPRYPEQWALPAIGAPFAWGQLPADAPKVTVAVIDSGICADHLDLAGRIERGWDFLESDSVPQDDFGHGCSVSGVIAANMNDGIGIAGLAPNAQIMPLRVLNASGVGSYSDVAAAIVYAADNGAQVLNLSLGGSNPSTTLENAVNYAISKGVIVVAAAGNNGAEGVLYPAAYPDVITVGSVDPNLERSSFSNYGSQIDIWAPGRDILTTKSDGSYGLVSGTSFAAPYVAGAEAINFVLEYILAQTGNLWIGTSISIANTPTISVPSDATVSSTPVMTNLPITTPIPSETYIATETPTNESVDIDSWQVYIDQIYGYSIKIPSNWSISPTPLDNYGGSAVFTSYNPDQIAITTEGLPPGSKIDIGVYGVDHPDDIPLEAWLKPNNQPGANFVESTQLIVANRKALQIKYSNDLGSYIVVYIPRGGKVYYFTYPLTDVKSTKLVEKVLATFDFVSDYTREQTVSATLYAEPPSFGQLEFPVEVQSASDYILPFTGKEVVTNGPGCSNSHSLIDSEAIDFDLNDEPVFAARRGWAGYYPNTDYGNLIRIIHPDGEISWYAHLSSPRIPNDNSLHYVEQGQIIAISGNTGPNTTGSHLHFHVRNHEDTATINIRSIPVIALSNSNANPPCMPSGVVDGVAYGPPALFENLNYGGKAQLMSQLIPDLRNIWMGHDNASSLWIASPWSMRVCKNENYGGSCKIYSPSSFGDEISIPNLGTEHFADGTIIDENITSVEAGLFCIRSAASEASALCGEPSPTPIPTRPTATPPPPSDGIEIVSVSSHVVSPGAQFNPSITIRHISGELVANRDHLHAIPEDNSNAFGAWPVQPLRSNVPIGGTYTFDVNNDSGFRMTAPSTPGQYQSIWQMRVNGVHVGPQAVINITVRSDPITTPLPTPTIDCNNPPEGITLYEFTDFRGRCINFTSDVMFLGNTYFGDDVASSLRVVGNWGVTLFQAPDWNGTWQEFSSNNNNLSDDLISDNQASSLRVWRPGDPCGTLLPGVTLYRGRDFTGISQTFNRDVMFLGNEPIGNDTVNSLRVCGNYRVTLYRDPDWTGFAEEFTGSDSNLSDNPMNNPNPNASSLRIIDANDACNSLPSGVTLYSEMNFGGRSQTFSSNVMYLGNTSFGNDAAKSLRVCGHWTVTISRDPDWNGQWENFTGPDNNLSDNPTGLNNASSLRMVDSYDFCRTLGPGVTLYRGRDFTGIAQTFTGDASFLGNGPIGNDTVTSIRQCGYNSRLYRDPDWQGFSEEFTGREESNLTDNQIGVTSSSLRVWTIPPTPTPTVTPTPTPIPAKPDLVPFDGSNWPFPLIPSSVPGDHSVSTLYAGQITYLDWGIFNNSNVNVTTPFKVRLYLDGTQINEFSYTSLDANAFHGIDDWNIYVDTPGYHILKISVDSNNEIIESNEDNNSWEGSFYWHPISATCPPITDWKGEYWANPNLAGSPILCRNDADLNLDWGLGSPDPLIPNDHFSARWTRTITFNGGTYRFHFRHDDGARFYIDEVLRSDVWDTCCVWETVDMELSAGTHELRMDYIENGGAAHIQLWWELIDQQIPVTISGNAGVGGTTLGYVDGAYKTVTADGNGNYSILVPAGWTGTVAAHKSGYTFTPSSRSYNNLQSNQTGQDYTAQVCAGCTAVEVHIAGQLKGIYTIPMGGRVTPLYNNLNNGPVKVVSPNGTDIITSERAYRGPNYTDWNEMLGFPVEQLTTEYWFPLYDTTGIAQTFISIGNTSPSTAAEVSVYIAGNLMDSYTIPVGGRVTPIYNGINNGPVRVVSTNGVPIITSERAYRGANYTDWNEMLGFPVEQLTTEYWFPLYDTTGIAQTFISIGNTSPSTAAEVSVYIAGNLMDSYTIPVGGRVTPIYDGINNGPVRVVSTNGVPIITSERAYRGVNYTDWNEMIGLPVEQLTTEYWFPLCDGTGTAQTFISIGNASQTPAEVTVKIAGQVLGNYTIPVGGRVTPMCTGINNGPVQVYSTNGTDLIVSERAYRGTNYTDWNEMLGLPVEQLTTEYWFPLYDTTGTAQTFLTIGNAQ